MPSRTCNKFHSGANLVFACLEFNIPFNIFTYIGMLTNLTTIITGQNNREHGSVSIYGTSTILQTSIMKMG